ncbi:SpaH/EbpB family LPXTG-anchored major pilin [Corynebacterium singulare]|uniref:Putative collagen-binding protein n=1 Tax=Corynebacterium singulare TaxID=161899 RepID=A0A0B6ETT0_9CORY|nr:SpaH/EbpB family LPXTG-anchored major pilin [Corynebacterium singulare]AJI78228.1 putative collagen-binding protein [Corynebacterium singulare]
MNKFKKALVAAVATGLVISGPGVGAAVAEDANKGGSTEETTTPATPDTPEDPGTIDKNKKSTLTIHKFSNNEPGQEGNGLERGDTDGLGTALKGAEFEIKRVDGFDLTTNKGWEDLSKVTTNDEKIAELGAAAASVATGETDANGVLAFDNLEVGVYYVEETKAPAGHEISTKPFLVTVPMTNPETLNEWNYDVHVYPKNKKVDEPNKPSKKVNDEKAPKVGDTVSYEATSPVQKFENLTRFKIRDFYPADRLEPHAIEPITSVTITGNKNGVESTETLDVNDYAVKNDVSGQTDILLTAEGIKKVNAFDADDARKVVVNLDFTVIEAAEGVDTTAPIVNKLGVKQTNNGTPGEDPGEPEEPGTPDEPGDPDEWPKSYYGDVQIKKVGDEGKALENVVFDVYQCNSKEDLSAEALIKDAAKTDASGVATIKGLRANNWVNNQAWPLDNKDQDGDPRAYLGYCLVETQTGKDHELLAEPVFFQIEAANDKVELTSLDITNAPHNGGFDLPLTGGQGVLYLLAGGVMLLVLAGGATYVLRRREA